MRFNKHGKWLWLPMFLALLLLACGEDSSNNANDEGSATESSSSENVKSSNSKTSPDDKKPSSSESFSCSSTESSSSKKGNIDCPDDSQCHLFKENDISTWKFTIKDSLGNDIEYFSKIHYIEKDKWGIGDFFQLSWMYVIAPGDTGIEMRAQSSTEDGILNIPNIYENSISSCEYKIANQPCRRPVDTLPDVNCYRTYVEIEPGNKLEVAECENGDVYLYDTQDVLFRKDIPDDVKRRFPFYDEHIGANCKQSGSLCVDSLDAAGHQSGGCSPTLYCPWKD